MTARAVPGLLLVAICATGCVSPIQSSVAESRLAASGRYRIITGLTVPAVRGAEGCGAQALATIFAYVDPAVDAETCAEALPWHDVGATPVDLLLVARERGFDARVEHGVWADLLGAVRREEPVLVMFDAGPEVQTLTGRLPTRTVMHWAVVSGFALDESELLLAAREGGRGARHHVVKREDFIRRWEKGASCSIRVSPPARSTP